MGSDTDGSDADGADEPLSSSPGADDENEFTEKLKRGLPVLLHVKVGKPEAASLKVIDETGKLVIKTDREGWCSWCHCHTRRYEIGPGQLEPAGVRAHTRKLHRSITIINGGDTHLVERMLPRSISLLCRHPKPVSIDLTFETANLEEDFRLWVNKRLTISLVSVVEKSNKSVSKALQGLSPSDNDDDNDSDDDTAFSEDQSRQTEPRLTSSHSTPGTSARGGKGGSAVVYPASRRTGALKQRQSQSERWDRQPASARSDPGRLKDEESTYKAMWTWKEPPVLRKLDSGSSSGSRPRSARARSLSRARGGITSLSEEAAAAGAGAAGAAGPPRSDRPLSMTASGSAADFWDPFGLMSDVTSMTPPAKKTVPSRGSRRDFLLSSGGSGKGGSR
ncbi:unnamed protein product, partial [Scytosiphon promiscuus]